jgi:hybrid cluster-associated redox disulfide protein
MEVAAPIVAVLALICAIWAVRRSAALGQQLEASISAQSRLRAELAELRAGHEQQLVVARREALRSSGDLKFDPGMTIAEAMAIHPGVADVLASFQLGSCPNCAVSDVDTIAGACQSYGVEQATLMKSLSRLLELDAGQDKLRGVPPTR